MTDWDGMVDDMGPKVRGCIGFGGREGVCENEATANPPTLLWCDECEAARVASISTAMESITRAFEEERRG